MLTGKIETFANHSQFKNLADFNKNVEMFLAVHKNKFTKTEFMLFRRLTKFGAKIPGVANASIKTILAGTKEKDFKEGASESTFHRMKRKVIELGFLETMETERKNGSQSSNLWIFKRFVSNSNTIDTPQTEGEQVKQAPTKEKEFRQLTPLKTRVLYKANIQNINKRIGDVPSLNKLDHSFTSDYVPKDFVATVKPFFDDAKTIEEYWKMVKIDTYKIQQYLDEETVVHTAMHSLTV